MPLWMGKREGKCAECFMWVVQNKMQITLQWRGGYVIMT